MKKVVAFQAWWLTKLSEEEAGSKEGQKVQLRPDEVMWAGGNSKEVGDVRC